LVHNHICKPPVLTARNRDFQDVGLEARQIPESNRGAEGRNRVVTDREASRKQVLVPRLGSAGASIDTAPDGLETAGCNKMVELSATQDRQRLLGCDKPVLTVSGTTQLAHGEASRRGVTATATPST
jgi:hypothetical protein